MNIQLFIDNGSGFSEQSSLIQAVSIVTQEHQTFKFELSGYRHIKNLRLDPFDQSAVIHIDKILLITPATEINLLTFMRANTSVIDGSNYFFSDNDPQIYFDFLDENDLEHAQQLIVRLRYRYIGHDARLYCHLALINKKNNIDASKVTVIVPNFNYGKFLEKRLNSIINQSVSPYEIIFLDDASCDNSLEIAHNLLSTTPIPYRIIRNDQNMGVFHQWIKGIQLAKGDYIWIAEADDYCEHTFMEVLLESFAKCKDLVLAYCQSKLVDDQDNVIDKTCSASIRGLDPNKWLRDYIEEGRTEIKNCLVYRCTIPNASAVIFRKEAFLGIEQWLAHYKNCGDLFVYCYILLKGKIAYSAQVLNTFRRHDECVTHKNRNNLDYIHENLSIKKFIGDYFSFSTQEINNIKYFMDSDFKLDNIPAISDLDYAQNVFAHLEHKTLAIRKGHPASLISVILPSYNHARFIKQAIDSVLRQEGVDFELLVLDDASSDASLDVISSIKDKRMSFFYHKENQGAAATLNDLLSRASGEYIAVLNSDDYWLGTDKLAYQLQILQQNPNLGACFGQAHIIDKNNMILKKDHPDYEDAFEQPNRSRGQWLRHFFYFGNALCHSTLLIRKMCYDTLGIYNNSLRQLHDLDLWQRLLKKYDIFVSERELVNFRILPGQNSSGSTIDNLRRTLNEHYLINHDFFTDLDQALLKDGFSDVLKNNHFISENQLEIEKTLMYFNHNPNLGAVHQRIGIVKLEKLLQQKDTRTILLQDYGINDFWFHKKLAEVN